MPRSCDQPGNAAGTGGVFMLEQRNVFNSLDPRDSVRLPVAVGVGAVRRRRAAVLYRRPMFSCSMYGSTSRERRAERRRCWRSGTGSVASWKLCIARADLLHVVAATHAGGGLADLLHRRQQQPDEDGDDGDHDQQFDEGESCPAGHQVNSNVGGSAGVVLNIANIAKISPIPCRPSGQEAAKATTRAASSTGTAVRTAHNQCEFSAFDSATRGISGPPWAIRAC